MKIKFIGVPGERHEGLPSYGLYFPLGKAVQVDDPKAMRKLRHHPHFEVVDDVEDAVVTETKTYADGTTATGAPPLPEHSPAEQRAALELEAAALHMKVDGRWSDERLRAEIDKKSK